MRQGRRNLAGETNDLIVDDDFHTEGEMFVCGPTKFNLPVNDWRNSAFQIKEIESAVFTSAPMDFIRRLSPEQNADVAFFFSVRRKKYASYFENGYSFRSRANISSKHVE